MWRIGIDVGGTFTDLAAVDETGRVVIAKCASTPRDQSKGLMEGLGLLAVECGTDLVGLLKSTERIVHGTTVATNALLERKGAKVGLLTTEGHRDVIEMREGLKDDRYNVRMPPPVPLVPRARRLGVRERVAADGRVTVALAVRSLAAALETLARARVDSIAVCYLHAYRNPRHERLTARAVARRLRGVHVSLSSVVLPQIKEYERVWTTVVNAYVGPALARYLNALRTRLAARGYRGDVLIMQSHGGVAPIRESARLAAGAVLSGPAGGIAAGRYAARLLDTGDLITFDMGGTSTDIALLQRGEPALTGEKTVGMAKVALPSLDIHTLGAGGGSIARVDAGGILHVGPESAGAAPGPACYAKGGDRATVTDANVVLGFLDPANFLGGRIALDRRAAEGAVDRIARALGTERLAAAEGIAKVVDTNMAEGIKIVSVRRGVDPRKFTLVAFGGAAGLHVTQVARLAPATLRRLFAAMEADGRKRLGPFTGRISVRRSLDMRYGEQIFEIPVSLEGVDVARADLLDEIVARFHRRHEELYAYSASGQEVVVVNARVAVVGELPPLATGRGDAVRHETPKAARRRVWLGDWVEIPVFRLDDLPAGWETKGPALFESPTTTVLARAGERVSVTPHGWLDLRLT